MFEQQHDLHGHADELEAIRLLLARYCFLIDRDRDPEAIVRLFAPDGSWEGLGQGRKQGAALREFMEQVTSADVRMQHIVSGPEIRINGDMACARSSLLVVKVGPPPELLFTGIFDDTFRRIDGQWLFKSRSVVTP